MVMTPAKSTNQIEVFFDGACPLCRREIGLLERWDRHHRIRFTDIAGPEFRPENVEKTLAELMDRMHGRLPDGTWLTGVEVFRRMYAAVGFGPIVWLTRLPGISHLMDWGYRAFARNRLSLTGRCTSETCAVRRQNPSK